MANFILVDLPWGADLFDVMGRESNWLPGGVFQPEDDAGLNYYRTLAYQRPYGLLMNTDFNYLTHDLVERYFQICLFYGIYPSMFSHDAATDPYWENPTLYERDRPLFQRYIPLIRRLNAAGWQPVTLATLARPDVYIERFGTWPDLFWTLRNTLATPAEFEVRLEAAALGLPSAPMAADALLAGVHYSLSPPAALRVLTVTLAAQASEILYLPAAPLSTTVAITRSGNHVGLRWPHTASNAAYEVWRSAWPYFTPDDGDSIRIGEAPAPAAGEATYSDATGGPGDPAVNYFYLVRGINAAGRWSSVSNRVGEFDFAIVPGQ